MGAGMSYHDVKLILDTLGELKERLEQMSVELDRLKAEVARNTEVSNSVVTLVNGLAQQIRDHMHEPAELAKLADELDATSDKLGQAVADNTPTPPGP
jgi:ABC-type transporter Mla subunit MlaD